ncbi:MAG TPA: DUF5916 domain-containing protein [Bacteroidota bacterium]
MRILFVILIPTFLVAGSNPKTAFAVRTPTPPTIDGRLNDPVWQLARPETTFTQYEPIEGAPPNEKTEIRFLYDDQALYVACRMYDPEPDKIVARLARRDDEVESDYVSLRIDSYEDNQTDFEFTVSAAGVKTDILEFDDGLRQDASWDVVWDVRTSIDSEGWVAEFRIPFQTLRFSQKETHDWGLQILRSVSRTQEHLYWVLIPKSQNGWASRFGHLKGISGIQTSTSAEILPYVLGSARTFPPTPANTNGRDFTSNAGFDLKYRPSVSLTVDATINPDFGQVEADPAVLNLTTFQTFYPEKRPFFIEGSQIIHFSTFGDNAGPGLFYSRRIGRPISVYAPPGGYVEDQPDFATILGAVKLSGKTEDGLSIGALEAMTNQEKATVVDSTGARSNQLVEPLSNFSLIRLKQDILQNSNVGMIVTNVSRRGALPAITGGVDWNVRFFENEYHVDGFLATTHTTTADPIVQNADGSYHDGPAGRVTFNKEGGPHWRWSLDYDFTTKGFNDDDIGYFRRPNDRGSVNTIQYRQDVPGSLFQRWNASAIYHYRSNFDNAELFNSFGLQGEILLPSYWDFQYTASFDAGKYDDRETRGNGLYRKPLSRAVQFMMASDPRLPVTGNLSATVGNDTRGSSNWDAAVTILLKPVSSVTLQFTLENYRSVKFFAWVANRTSVDDSTLSPNTVNSIFAQRSVSQWDLVSRGSFVFARDLTLQYYVQVFFANGKFENTQRMISNDTFTPYVFSPGVAANPPDFTSLSFNSNIVLRWEYMPGSTAYFVWSQARLGNAGGYATPFGENFSNTLGLPATNVFMLKVSYWLSY